MRGRDTPAILERAADVLDVGQPVAVMLLGILQGIPDQDDPGAIVGGLMDAVPPGSYLAISQIASDVAADEVEPGIVQVHRWRPGTGDLGNSRNLAIYAGVGRRP